MLKTEVLIVGAGPVGLFLGCCLAKQGIGFKVIEKRTHASQHSRAVGIHPPSLELFSNLGIEAAFLEKGVHIPAGKAFANQKELGTLSFKDCPKPYPFILTLAQSETEQILERTLKHLAPDSLLRGCTLTHLETYADKLEIFYQTAKTASESIEASYVIACDGKDSLVRELAAIPFIGDDYPDTYIMGDFADTTDLAQQAGIYLTDEGLIESFPLPNNLRRWVVKTNHYLSEPSKEHLAKLVKERLEHDLALETNSMMSSFGVQHYLAKQFVKDRVILAGDAAHVLSPIGGQGMNLGWLDAWALSQTLEKIIKHKKDAHTLLRNYDKTRQKAAKKAIQRAAFNMRLGRKTRFSKLKYAFVKLMLATPLERVFAYVFTMRWL